jgi:archaellum component FlaC
VKKQIQELREVAQIFQSELYKVQDSENAMKKHVQTRIEEVERQVRSKVQELEDAFSRINKNLDKDF